MNIKLFYNESRDLFLTAIEIQTDVFLCSYDAVKYSGKSFENRILKATGWELVGFYEIY